jgi:hypothetical protein
MASHRIPVWRNDEMKASDDTISLLLRTQAHQIGHHLAEELARAYDLDLDDVFALVGEIELPK